MESGSIPENVSSGKGIVEKKPFEVVGSSKEDLETGGHGDIERGRGRPPIDKNWTSVGRTAEQEQGKK